MEKCHGSVLDMFMRQSKSPCDWDILGVLAQMLEALRQVHACNIAQRDVKPENFLAGGQDGTTVKLCDFGLSAMVPRSKGLTAVVGTPPYMSPEMLQGKAYTSMTDIWSFGSTAYLLFYGEFPHQPIGMKQVTPQARKNAIKTNCPKPRFLPRNRFTAPNEEVVGFIKSLIQREKGVRLSAAQALNSPLMVRVLERKSPEDSCTTDASLSRAVTPNIELAQQKALQYKQVGDPTRAKTVDDLFSTLQSRCGGRQIYRFPPRGLSKEDIFDRQDMTMSTYSMTSNRIMPRSFTDDLAARSSICEEQDALPTLLISRRSSKIRPHTEDLRYRCEEETHELTSF